MSHKFHFKNYAFSLILTAFERVSFHTKMAAIHAVISSLNYACPNLQCCHCYRLCLSAPSLCHSPCFYLRLFTSYLYPSLPVSRLLSLPFSSPLAVSMSLPLSLSLSSHSVFFPSCCLTYFSFSLTLSFLPGVRSWC